MTPDQVTLVQQSFSKVAPISERASVVLRSPVRGRTTVQAMFPDDMTEQRKIDGTLAVVVNGFNL